MKIIRLDNHCFREKETLKDLYYSMGWNFAEGYPYQKQNEKAGIKKVIDGAIKKAQIFGLAILITKEARHYIKYDK